MRFFYLLDLLVNFISTCFVKCKLHIDNIQFFLFLWSIVLLANDIDENPGPEINDMISGGLTIFHLNIRSVRNKLCSILYLLDHDILCFTETHLDNSITDDILAIPGYDVIIRKDRAGIGKGLGGGIILYHKDYIKVDRRQECIWVEIRTKPQQTLLNISYISPQFTDINYWTLFNQSIGLAYISPNLLIVGDLNIDFLSRTPFYVNDVLSVNGLVSVIHEPTHFTVNSSSSIDPILVSDTIRTI
jgi:hypothetical protein